MNDIPISILTPTYNRARYLERVWEGLQSQSYQGFEWIVGDDGSVDDTAAGVRDLAARSAFPVTLIRASTRVGKARLDNEAIRQATGEFILWCDSDDYLLPNALERLLAAWQGIPANDRDDYVGITALCRTDTGVVVDPFPDAPYLDTTWNDLAEVHGVTADMIFFTRATALKSHPFPEVDFVIPESVVWTAIGHRKARFIHEVLKVIEYGSAHCISFSNKMEYNRGRAYALAATVCHLSGYPQGFKVRLWRAITFVRYCLHGEIGYRKAWRLWGNNSSRRLFRVATLCGWLLALKDRWQGKVVKTHRDFLAAREVARITIEPLKTRDP